MPCRALYLVSMAYFSSTSLLLLMRILAIFCACSKMTVLAVLMGLVGPVAWGAPRLLVAAKQRENCQAIRAVKQVPGSPSYLSNKSPGIAKDALEVGKVMVMCTIAAVTYGVVHDLITTQVNFDYFASDRTHHGPYTRKYYPCVYKANNRVLYALLWGTVATWWVGLPLGAMWGLAARCGNGREKLGWRDLVRPAGVCLGCMLATSLVVGLKDYAVYGDTFSMVAAMHNASYMVGILGGLAMSYYVYRQRRPVAQVVQWQPNGVVIDLVALLRRA